MILPNLVLPSFANQTSSYSGIDTYDVCIDKKHFLAYPYEVTYQYNTRGFRGSEWPSNLDNIIWCVGDSFTAGLGTPYHHTWHQVLENKLNINTINVSLDGASNNWIARKIIDILEIKPKNLIVQWSYAHRRELKIPRLSDEDRRIFYDFGDTYENDIQNNIDCINLIESNKKETTIIHTFVPQNIPKHYESIFRKAIEKLNINVVWFDQLDFARDSVHYDIQTSSILAEKLIQSKYINI
jgi:hypothetical protein